MAAIQLNTFKHLQFDIPGSYEFQNENRKVPATEGQFNPAYVAEPTGPTIVEKGSIKETKDSPVYEVIETSVKPGKNYFVEKVQKVQYGITTFFKDYGTIIKRIILALLAMFYAAYFAYALNYRFGDEGSIRLLWVTCLVSVLLVIGLIKKYYGSKIYDKVIRPPAKLIQSKWKYLRWIIFPLIIIGFLLFIILDIARHRPYNLVSLSGVVLYVIIFFIFSHNPGKVKWRPVLWGIALQFILGLIVLRTSWGQTAFKWLGSRVKEFLEHTNAGSKFVFGPKYTDHPFAMKVMPIVIFFSTVISVLYYIGAMQFIIAKLAWIMRITMGTTAAESMNAAGNIFVGQTEAPLLIRPLIHRLTRSEIHAVMVGGFATIAGGVMASFIAMGIPANHLLTASVMSAPAALAMSKLSYPEEETSVTTTEEVNNMERPPYRNPIEAASAGASSAIKLVANIIANLIAFMALLTFVNATLKWFGARVGLEPPQYPELTFQLICSYVLWPLPLVMGVVVRDCRKVAELLGMKIFINEFVTYTELSRVIQNRVVFDAYKGNYTELNNGDIYLQGTNTTLIGGIMHDRSIAISTYALCGFANISSIGITLGGLGAMAPERKSEMASFAVRAMLTGATASFMTACFSGLLFQGK